MYRNIQVAYFILKLTRVKSRVTASFYIKKIRPCSAGSVLCKSRRFPFRTRWRLELQAAAIPSYYIQVKDLFVCYCTVNDKLTAPFRCSGTRSRFITECRGFVSRSEQIIYLQKHSFTGNKDCKYLWNKDKMSNNLLQIVAVLLYYCFFCPHNIYLILHRYNCYFCTCTFLSMYIHLSTHKHAHTYISNK